MNNELKKYIESIDGISHITFDPKGPDVVRIHLIPPAVIKPGTAWIIIINGQDILPIGFSWAILLRIFIEKAYKYDNKLFSSRGKSIVYKDVVDEMLKLFDNVRKDKIIKDLDEILLTLVYISKGKVLDNIGHMTMADYAPNMRAPIRMDLMISAMEKDGFWNCNQKCIHCYAAGQVLSNQEELSTMEWKTIIDKLKKEYVSQITFTGGEPTMRDDLVELVEYSKWFVTRLNTNGIGLTPSLCKELYDASLDSVQVTLYSHKPEIHNLLVGAQRFDATISGIKNAIKENLNVSINTPLCSLNEDYVELVKWAHQNLGIRYFTCSGLIISGNATKAESKETQLSKVKITEALTKAVSYARDNELDIQFTSPGWITKETLKKKQLNIPSCGACLSNMGISPNGDVIPCQSWLDEAPLGNLLKEDFRTIWRSKKCKSIRNKSALVYYTCQLREINEKRMK